MTEKSDIKNEGDNRIRFEILNRLPMELGDLTASLAAFGEEYYRYVQRHPELMCDPRAKLYIREIRSGSVIADLEPYIPPVVLAFVENYDSIVKYVAHIRSCIFWLLGIGNNGLSVEPEPEMDRTTLENICTIVEPSVKDSGSFTNISTVINGDVQVTINLNSVQANAVQNQARRKLKEIQEPVSGNHERVVMFWYRTTADANKTTGDRAIIESIAKKPVKIEAPPGIKEQLMGGEDNPLKQAFIVDVTVETVRDIPVLYKVTRFHGRVELE